MICYLGNVILVQFKLTDPCTINSDLTVTAYVQKKEGQNWVDYGNDTFTALPNLGGNYVGYTSWTDTSITGSFSSKPDNNNWRVKFIAKRQGCSDQETGWITFSPTS